MNETEMKATREKLQARMDSWDAQAADLRAKAREAKADTRLKIEGEIKKIEAMQDNAKKKLDELKTSGKDAWNDLTEGLDTMMNEIDKTIKSIGSRFN